MIELKSIESRFREIAEQYPVLSEEEERKLCERYANDRDKLNELLVLHNIRFAMSMVKKYREHSEVQEDLWMRGIMGLVVAAKEYDLSMGTRFCSYAARVIQSQFRDLFCPTLNAPKTQLATRANFDAPIGNHTSKDEGKESATLGDVLANGNHAPDWVVHDPGEDDRKRVEKEDVDALIDYLVANVLSKYEDCTERLKEAARLRMRGYTLEASAQKIGVTRERVRQLQDKAMSRIRFALEHARSGSELFGVLNGSAHGELEEEIDLNKVHRFISDNHIVLIPDGLAEDEKAHVKRIMDEYDLAENELRIATGRIGGGADFRAMRMVYESWIARHDRIEETAAKIGIPKSYAKFLRDKAVRMVKQHKAGLLKAVCAKNHDGADPGELHRLKDELYQVGEISEGVAHTNWGKFNGAKKNPNKRGLLTTIAPYRGGFYSHIGYLSFATKRKRRAGMSLRELAMHIRIGNIPAMGPKRMEEFVKKGEAAKL